MHLRIVRLVALAGAVMIALVAGLTTGANAGASAPEALPPNPLLKVMRQVKGLKPAARERRLLQLAKAEGSTLEWYTSLSSPISKEVEEAFEKQYSDIKVNRFRGSSESVSQRVREEAAANKSGADVIETNGSEMLHFQHRKNILVPFSATPYRSAVPKFARFDTWTADRMEYFVVAWNKNLLPSGGVPKSFDDLGTARWRGKLSLEPTDVDWYAALWTYYRKKGRSVARVNTMFRNIARNSVLTSGHTAQATLLAAGQFSAIVTGHAQSVQNLMEDGAPIEFKPFVRPVIQRPQGVGIAYRLGHPATAILFYDWLLSRRGQTVLRTNHVEPARRDMSDPAFRGAPIVYMNLRPIISHWADWTRRYDAVTQLARNP